MSYKFHYNEKVKIIHGFYAGNEGIVMDVVDQPITRIVSFSKWRYRPIWETVGIKRSYHVVMEDEFADSFSTHTILEQHLEKA